MDNMVVAATRLAAILITGELSVAMETRNTIELLHTMVAQQANYSYSRKHVHSTLFA